MNDLYAHRGQLPPNDAAFIRSRKAGRNIWWGHRRWFWLARLVVAVLNVTQTKGADNA